MNFQESPRCELTKANSPHLSLASVNKPSMPLPKRRSPRVHWGPPEGDWRRLTLPILLLAPGSMPHAVPKFQQWRWSPQPSRNRPRPAPQPTRTLCSGPRPRAPSSSFLSTHTNWGHGVSSKFRPLLQVPQGGGPVAVPAWPHLCPVCTHTSFSSHLVPAQPILYSKSSLWKYHADKFLEVQWEAPGGQQAGGLSAKCQTPCWAWRRAPAGPHGARTGQRRGRERGAGGAAWAWVPENLWQVP